MNFQVAPCRPIVSVMVKFLEHTLLIQNVVVKAGRLLEKAEINGKVQWFTRWVSGRDSCKAACRLANAIQASVYGSHGILSLQATNS